MKKTVITVLSVSAFVLVIFAIKNCCFNSLGDYYYIDSEYTIHFDTDCKNIEGNIEFYEIDNPRGAFSGYCPHCVTDKKYKEFEKRTIK